MSSHMMHERRLLKERLVLEKKAKKKYDELDAIFFKIAEINRKIEEQIVKQVNKNE